MIQPSRHRFNVCRVLFCLVALLAAIAPPLAAEAVEDERRDYRPRRRPGGPLEDEPPTPPMGWRLGPAISSPYAVGVSLAYLMPGRPVTYKFGATWGIVDEKDTIAFALSDGRLYGAILYYLLPDALGGPYLETGLGIVRSSGGVTNLGWPVIPHLGFGSCGKLSETLGWDLNFSISGNGLSILEGGLLF